MKIQPFLEHHGIVANPFADEDAQTDLVFKGYCITQTYHPFWDKIYGNPAEPATAIVFGEKGSGKTALRLQIARHLGDSQRRSPRRPGAGDRLRRFQSLSGPLSRAVSRPAAQDGALLGALEALGPHGRHPVAGRDATGRSDSRDEAGEPSGGLRPPAAGDRVARALPGPRRAAAGGLLRPIDGPERRRAMAAAAAEAAFSDLADAVGPRPARGGRRGGRSP